MSRFASGLTGLCLIATFACSPDSLVEPSRNNPAIAAASTAPQTTADYEMIDLGLLGSPGRIDKKGTVYALSRDANFQTHIVRWEDGVVTDLGAIPGAAGFSENGVFAAGAPCDHESDTCSFFLFHDGAVTALETGGTAYRDGSAITFVGDDGSVVGRVANWDQYLAGTFTAFLWQDGARRELQPIDAQLPLIYTANMNKHGQLVGTNTDVYRTRIRPYLWENGVARDLGSPFDDQCAASQVPCGARALWINKNGDVVGYGNDPSGNSEGVIWRQSGRAEELGVFPGQITLPEFINDRGDIWGFGGPQHWWVLKDGVLYGPGAPAGSFTQPAMMNERSELVGYLFGADRKNHAFVWRNGQMTDLGLGPEGSQFVNGITINERGEILAAYMSTAWQQGIVVWRPVPGKPVAT